MPNYELTYILRPVDETNLDAANARIANLLSAAGGEIAARNDWGRRRLAYPIRKFTDGYYTTLYIRLPAPAVRNVERALKLMDDVLRFLVVRVESHTLPKPLPGAEPAPAAVKTPAPGAAAAEANVAAAPTAAPAAPATEGS